MLKLFKRRARKKCTPTPRKPGYWITRAVLLAMTALFASFVVIEWAAPLWRGSPQLAIFIAALFGVSALVTPVIMAIIVHARGAALVGLVFVGLTFGAVDTIGLSKAFDSLETRLTQVSYQIALDARKTSRQPLADAVSKAQRDVETLPTATAACEGLGPITCKDRRIGLASDRAIAETALVSAQRSLANFDQQPAPIRPDMFDNRLMALLSLALQLALVMAFSSIEATRSRIHTAALAKFAQEAADKADKRAANRLAIEKAKTKTAKAERANAQAERPPKGLHLVAAND